MSHGNEMICQAVTLSGYAEWPKVADAVIEAVPEAAINSFFGLLKRKNSRFQLGSKEHDAYQKAFDRLLRDLKAADGQPNR